MAEHKSVALVILGVVAILAVVGLVLLFTRTGTTGGIVTMAGCDSPATPVLAEPGVNDQFLDMWTEAGYTCLIAPGQDEYRMKTWCCTPPAGVPVDPHYVPGNAPITPISYDYARPGYPGYRANWEGQ
ncbi:hypothetical protein KY333_03530 [Candidatus Woesearchaeota archaeon]|nr:hypothetical protein [Candidatus Woesearchaeota archaeon]